MFKRGELGLILILVEMTTGLSQLHFLCLLQVALLDPQPQALTVDHESAL